MSDLLKPLYSLTIGEYKELQREIFNEQAEKILKKDRTQPLVKENNDIIFLEEVCEITGYTKPTLYSKISRYEIPVLSRGKPLTFSKKDIIDWIHQGKPNTLDDQVKDYLKSNPL
ncbi:helix-turn-helix domain-containing protein [Aquimarina pacifica]|uniref:helix-turn-helix domain-containing protein n=1 Tax=Aquimarina pacifica TaxID=1296415 RepID=UPI00046FED73|nr:helix-turn-helix domain-containing protein [Aquimarina pacifica]